MRHLRSITKLLNTTTRSLQSNPLHSLSSSSSSSNLHQKPTPNILLPIQSIISRRESTQTQTPTPTKQEFIPSQNVLEIVDQISGLTQIEMIDLFELLRERCKMQEIPIMGIIMPGATFSAGGRSSAKGGGGKVEEEKKEKTAFDLKLDGFDAAAKIKIIKEVRTFTDLGLKEAKDLVEKAPTLLKKGVAKEEAEKIIQKMKEIGAKVSME